MTSALLVTVVMALIASLMLHQVEAQSVDQTIIPEAKGEDVVLAVVARIRSSKIFPSDNQFLRRIAHVESRDGNHPRTYRQGYHGGIWQVDRIGFRETQLTDRHPGLVRKHMLIHNHFEIDWTSVEWEDLRKPLYSGLAARLFLSNIEEPIPPASDIRGQAKYWKQHYNTKAGEGTEEKFVRDVTVLVGGEKCQVNTDLIFVLDSSGSIGDENYARMISFVHQYVSELDIGENANRVGVIIYSSNAEVVFNLNTYLKDKQGLLNAINNIRYISGGTDTAAGLSLLVSSGFTEAAGARVNSQSVVRVAILITDGRSGTSVNSAAANVHSVDPPILVYAVGVGNFVLEELEVIATSTDFVNTLESFSDDQLLAALEERQFQICNELSRPAILGQPMRGALQSGEVTRLQFQVPQSGVDIEVCATMGGIEFYASTTVPNPNEAFNDVSVNPMNGECATAKVRPNFLTNLSSRRKRFTPEKRQAGEEEDTVPLYVSLEGISDDDSGNVFTLEVEEDTCLFPADSGSCDDNITRYFFNSNSGRCESFTYSGCDGNQNNFELLELCKQSCNPNDCPPYCSVEYCSNRATRRSMCTIPTIGAASDCNTTCRLTFCHTCYYSDEVRENPNKCDPCVNSPEMDVDCFRKWAVCTRRENHGLYGNTKRRDRLHRRFKCYEHPCVE